MQEKIRISIRTKLTILLLFIVSASILFVSIQAYDIALGDLSTNAKDKTRTYADGNKKVLETYLNSLQDKLVLLAQNTESTKIPKNILAYYEYTKNSDNFELIRSLVLPNYQFLNKINFKNLIKDDNKLKALQIKDKSFFIYKLTSNDKVFLAVLPIEPLLKKFFKEQGLYKNFLIDNKLNLYLAQNSKVYSFSHLDKAKLFQSFFDSKTKYELTKEFKSDTGNLIISIFKIPNTNIAVVSMIPKSIVLANANKLKIMFIVSSIFIFFLSVFLTLVFAKTITNPILTLSKITNRIAKGDFLVKIGIKSRDEIGLLADNFEKMGQELYSREKALKEAQEALVQSEKMSAFGQISAGIAHEIKNPMTGILGHTQLAKEKLSNIADKGQDLEKVSESLNIVEKETKRVKQIVENLMKFARQEKVELKAENLAKVVKDAIQFVDHQLTINLVKIHTEIDENLPPVKISANQIEQVLMNIMLNAQHAMEKKQEKHLTVRVKNSHRSGFARIEIEDTGTGIPDEVKAKIFEPFFTTKPQGKGTGLGLSVSYGIIKEHKGIIEVESELGKWTRFIIELPYCESRDLKKSSAHEVKEEVKQGKVEKTTNLEPIENNNEDIEKHIKSEYKKNKEDDLTPIPTKEIQTNKLIVPEKELSKSKQETLPPIPTFKRRGEAPIIKHHTRNIKPTENKNIDIKIRPVKRLEKEQNKLIDNKVLGGANTGIKIRPPKRKSE